MKIVTMFLLSILWVASSLAQSPTIDESAPLGELESGWMKLLFLKSGNTAFLQFDEKKGIKVKIYDPNHKQIADTFIEPSFGKLGMYGSIKSTFTINNQVVVMMSTVKKVSAVKANPLLYRIIIDGNTGSLVKDEQVGQLSAFGSGGEMAFKTGYLENPAFYIAKDPNSDNYAVAHFDSFESDRNKRLKLTHYGADHQIINEGYFLSLNDEYKYVSFIDMVVLGNSKLFVCAKIYNTKENKVKYTSIGCLDKLTSSFNQKVLEFTKDREIVEARLFYNSKSSSLILLNLTLTGSENKTKFMKADESYNYYVGNLTVINSNSLSIDFEKEITPPRLTKNYQNKFSEKGQFNGVLQAFYINEDNTYTIVFEEMSHQFVGNAVNTLLGSFGISVLNDKFQESASYLIPFSSFVTGEYSSLWSPNQNLSRPTYLSGENHFRTPAYFNKGSEKMLLLNDVEENFQKVKEGKILMLGSLGAADGYKLLLNEGKVAQSPLFPKSKKSHTFGMFIGSCYDSTTGNFATITRSNKKGWQNEIVWMKL